MKDSKIPNKVAYKGFSKLSYKATKLKHNKMKIDPFIKKDKPFNLNTSIDCTDDFDLASPNYIYKELDELPCPEECDESILQNLYDYIVSTEKTICKIFSNYSSSQPAYITAAMS